MSQPARDLVVMITHGVDHELSSAALTIALGGTPWACTPCVKSRGHMQEDMIDGVVITGASVMHERLLAGAATLSF